MSDIFVWSKTMSASKQFMVEPKMQRNKLVIILLKKGQLYSCLILSQNAIDVVKMLTASKTSKGYAVLPFCISFINPLMQACTSCFVRFILPAASENTSSNALSWFFKCTYRKSRFPENSEQINQNGKCF